MGNNAQFDEVVKTYSKKKLIKCHDQALTRFIEDNGVISIKTLSRVGQVPRSYITKWMKDENWEQFLEPHTMNAQTESFLKGAALRWGLTEQEELFCQHFMKTKNSTQASYKAGYSHYNRGYELLREARILKYLQTLHKSMCREIFIDSVDVVKMWAKIGFADMNDFVKVSAHGVSLKSGSDGQLISEVKEGREGVSIKLADRMKALDRLSSWLNILPENKVHDAKLRIMEKSLGGDEDTSLRIEIIGL